MFEGKIPLPENNLYPWIMWPFIALSAPLFLFSALAFRKANSLYARNIAFAGALMGVLVSFYTWSLLWGFGAA